MDNVKLSLVWSYTDMGWCMLYVFCDVFSLAGQIEDFHNTVAAIFLGLVLNGWMYVVYTFCDIFTVHVNLVLDLGMFCALLSLF